MTYHFYTGPKMTQAQLIISINARCKNIGADAGVILADPMSPRYTVKVRYGRNGLWVFTNQDGIDITCGTREYALVLAVEAGYSQVEQFITPDGRVWIC